MRTIFGLVSVGVIAVLSGCSGQPTVQAIDTSAVEAVQAAIKKQVGIYIAASQNPPKVNVNGVLTPVSQIPDAFACGGGAISFDISSIKAELTTTLDQTYGVSGSATIPADVVTVSPSVGNKTTISNSQKLDYEVWPLARASQSSAVLGLNPTDDDIKAAPIAKALLDLRDGLILSAMKYDYSASPPKLRPAQPCFTDYDPTKGVGGSNYSYTLGLSFTNDATTGLTIKVTIVSLGATGEWKSTNGNTLTTTFNQTDLDKVQAALDNKTAACKAPNQNSTACKDATTALNNISVGMGVMDVGVGLHFAGPPPAPAVHGSPSAEIEKFNNKLDNGGAH